MSTRRMSYASAILAVAGALGLSGAASAGGTAPTKVTIEGTGDVFGYVESPMKACMKDRKVVVFKQKGSKGGGDDEKVASDTAQKSGDHYQWSVGNPGINGKFYARARAIPGCAGDSSKTVSS